MACPAQVRQAVVIPEAEMPPVEGRRMAWDFRAPLDPDPWLPAEPPAVLQTVLEVLVAEQCRVPAAAPSEVQETPKARILAAQEHAPGEILMALPRKAGTALRVGWVGPSG